MNEHKNDEKEIVRVRQKIVWVRLSYHENIGG